MSESTKLMRHNLASIDLSDIDEKDMSEQERRDYCGVINAVFPRLEKDIKQFMRKQMIFSMQESETLEQLYFCRGVFEGFALLFEHWKNAHAEHLSRSSGEKFDQANPLNEV